MNIFVLFDFEDKLDPVLHFESYNQVEDYIVTFRKHHDNIIVREIKPNNNGGRIVKNWQWLRDDQELQEFPS